MTLLEAKQLEVYINDRLLLKADYLPIHKHDRIGLVGRNGSGKTTLLKKIIDEEEGITLSPSVKIGYFSQNIDILNTEQSILENVRSTSKQDETLIRTVLARLHFFRDDVYKPVGVLSGGERVKAALAKLFVSDMNTLILDEPTNYLDIEAVEALESLLQEYEGTVIFVSHDRRFIEKIANRIFKIENGEINIFEGTYQEFIHNNSSENRNTAEDELLLLETKISEILSRISTQPSAELEKEFQRLITKKRSLEQMMEK